VILALFHLQKKVNVEDLNVLIYFLLAVITIQGDHLSGKPGNVWEFDVCQRNVWEMLGKNVIRKMVYC